LWGHGNLTFKNYKDHYFDIDVSVLEYEAEVKELLYDPE
jgi:hypothetical protein